jgi:hypothetical protein
LFRVAAATTVVHRLGCPAVVAVAALAAGFGRGAGMPLAAAGTSGLVVPGRVRDRVRLANRDRIHV